MAATIEVPVSRLARPQHRRFPAPVAVGVAMLLAVTAALIVITVSRGPAPASAGFQATRPDAAIVDIRMPPTHADEGLVAAQQIRDKHPGVSVLILSQYVEPHYAMQLLEGHPERVGYLLRNAYSTRVPWQAAGSAARPRPHLLPARWLPLRPPM